VPARKYVGLAYASGDRLRLPAPNSEARQQKGNEGDATLDLVLKHNIQQIQHPDPLLKHLYATVVI
jgi:hypothetical protein